MIRCFLVLRKYFFKKKKESGFVSAAAPMQRETCFLCCYYLRSSVWLRFRRPAREKVRLAVDQGISFSSKIREEIIVHGERISAVLPYLYEYQYKQGINGLAGQLFLISSHGRNWSRSESGFDIQN